MFDNLSYNEQLKAVQKGLQEAKKAIDAILTDPSVQNLKIGILSDLDKPINRIGTLLGNFQLEETRQELKPVTSIFGVKVNQREPVTPGTAVPTVSEKDQFLKERDDLYDRITDMSDKEVFMLSREPSGIALIRSVAKKAGHPNYRDAEIDIIFLGEIRQLILKTSSQQQSIKEAEEGAEQLKNEAADKKVDEDIDDDEVGGETEEATEHKEPEQQSIKEADSKTTGGTKKKK